jgi:protein SCO1
MSGHVRCVVNLCMAMLLTGAPPLPAAGVQSAFLMPVWPAKAASPDFSLSDSAGQTRTLADFRGKAVVVFFGFLHCPDACPTELYKLSLSVKKLGSDAVHVQVLFVTLDPARDSAAMLKDYVSFFDPRFAALTGSAAQINRAAASFHVEFAKVPQGDDYTIDHSSSTFLFDKHGELRVIGTMQASAADIAHDLELLVHE